MRADGQRGGDSQGKRRPAPWNGAYFSYTPSENIGSRDFALGLEGHYSDEQGGKTAVIVACTWCLMEARSRMEHILSRVDTYMGACTTFF